MAYVELPEASEKGLLVMLCLGICASSTNAESVDDESWVQLDRIQNSKTGFWGLGLIFRVDLRETAESQYKELIIKKQAAVEAEHANCHT